MSSKFCPTSLISSSQWLGEPADMLAPAPPFLRSFMQATPENTSTDHIHSPSRPTPDLQPTQLTTRPHTQWQCLLSRCVKYRIYYSCDAAVDVGDIDHAWPLFSCKRSFQARMHALERHRADAWHPDLATDQHTYSDMRLVRTTCAPSSHPALSVGVWTHSERSGTSISAVRAVSAVGSSPQLIACALPNE